MIGLKPSEAVSAVRKNLDEQGLNDSVMYTDESTDNESLDLVIEKTLPEAINAVCLSVPAHLLEGTDVKAKLTYIEVKDKVLGFSIPETEKFLRFVRFRAEDSEHILTAAVTEESAEGRKQLNKYVCGTYDRPCLVQLQGDTTSPSFRYYSLKKTADAAASLIAECEIIPRQEYAAATESYVIPTGLRDTVVTYLTGMVLSIFGETTKADYFFKLTQS